MLTTLLIEYGKFILGKTRVSVTNGQIYFLEHGPVFSKVSYHVLQLKVRFWYKISNYITISGLGPS
jgi:hypothetical protein